MTLEDQYLMFIGAYYGIREMDEFDLKYCILNDIECYIKGFIAMNPISNYDYRKQAETVDDTVSLKTKLQDALLVLPKINAPLEVILLVKKELRKMREER